MPLVEELQRKNNKSYYCGILLTRNQMPEFDDFEKVFEVWNEVVPRQPIPEPLGYSELCKRLDLPEARTVTIESLLSITKKVLDLSLEGDDAPLIRASYYRLVQQHAPWAIKE